LRGKKITKTRRDENSKGKKGLEIGRRGKKKIIKTGGGSEGGK
jgi:hypothetical protein